MASRLGYFWIAMTGADILAALIGAGLLRMRGVLGYAGWRWMFLVEVCKKLFHHPIYQRNSTISIVPHAKNC